MRNATVSLLMILTALLALPALAAEYVMQLDPTETQIAIDLGATGHDVHGTFRLTSGEIHFDPATGEASGRLVVDATSGETGNGKRDKTMHRKVLESLDFPTVSFVPAQIRGQVATEGESEFTIHGMFEVHGQSHPVDMVTRATIRNGRVHADATFEVPFVDWGMHDPSMFFLRVQKQVEISISVDEDLTADTAQAALGTHR